MLVVWQHSTSQTQAFTTAGPNPDPNESNPLTPILFP
jgi:hypothetical protein